MWLPWIVLWLVLLCVSSILYPSFYPDTPPEELNFINTTKMGSGTALLLLFGYTMLYGWFEFERRATPDMINPYEARQVPTRETWNNVVRRANRGRTVRLANLLETQDPVSLVPFETGQQIALLPSGNRHTPFHLNMVQEMRRRPPFAHPMTRQRMRNENIEVVKITR